MKNTSVKKLCALVVAFLLIIGFIYLLFRPYKESNTLNVNVKSVAKAK